jgi:hypothetical protein
VVTLRQELRRLGRAPACSGTGEREKKNVEEKGKRISPSPLSLFSRREQHNDWNKWLCVCVVCSILLARRYTHCCKRGENQT